MQASGNSGAMSPSEAQMQVGMLSYLFVSMIMSILTVLGVILVIRPAGETSPDFARLMLGLVPAIGAALLAASVLIRRLQFRYFVRRTRQGDAPNTLARAWIQRYFAWMLVPAALAEGWGLLGVIALLVTGSYAMLVPAFIAIAAIIALFPTWARYEAFLHRVRSQS